MIFFHFSCNRFRDQIFRLFDKDNTGSVNFRVRQDLILTICTEDVKAFPIDQPFRQECYRVLVSLKSWPGQLLSLNPCLVPLRVLGGPEEAQYQSKVCGNHDSNTDRAASGSNIGCNSDV